MKYTLRFLILIISLSLFSCENACDVQTDIDKLRTERTNLENEVSTKNNTISQLNTTITSKNETLKEMDIYLDGDTPLYVLSLKLSQSHFTLDITEHMKDAMNAIEFDIPVDKDFYDNVKIGDEILDNFRMGSFIMNGSFGDWEMEVKHKKVIKN
jgi:hypothetical protein